MLLADAPASGYYDPPVRATWTAPDGVRRQGTVYPEPGARAGTVTPIWVTAAGRQMAWPMTPSQANSQAGVIAGLVVPFWGMILCGAGLLGRHVSMAAGWPPWTPNCGPPSSAGLARGSP